jgi:hypothetical protein
MCYSSLMNTETTTTAYTEHEAADMAVMLLLRKLRRELARVDRPNALDKVLSQLPEGAREALAHAEQRGDEVRFADEAAGVAPLSRPWPNRFADLENED